MNKIFQAKFVIFIAFPVHQLLPERPSTFRHSTLPNIVSPSYCLWYRINLYSLIAVPLFMYDATCFGLLPSAFCLFSSFWCLISNV